jgi:hypothetical protein
MRVQARWNGLKWNGTGTNHLRVHTDGVNLLGEACFLKKDSNFFNSHSSKCCSVEVHILSGWKQIKLVKCQLPFGRECFALQFAISRYKNYTGRNMGLP